MTEEKIFHLPTRNNFIKFVPIKKNIMALFLSSISILLLNIPFGYWRTNVDKFSLQWFLAIHLPVPIVVAIRFSSGMGFKFHTYIFFVSAFFIGQLLGKFVYDYYQKLRPENQSSCLVMDFVRLKDSQK